MNNSRTKNVAQNAWWAVVTQVFSIILSFISRTIFIYILGVEYLGINGLFSNILMILSFAELGIGNAIIYSMYKPLAIKDEEKIKSLMALYAKAYRLIGIIVFISGLIVIPFMDIIIKEMPNINENIIHIYLLFLINTTVSYFFVYKKSIIIADQKNYIVSLYQQLFLIIQVVLQIIFLALTHEYMLFLIIQIICTLSNNIVTARKADKMYPYLNTGSINELDKKEKQGIFKNVKALFLYKLASITLSGTDNIIISAIIGIAAVGQSSNYLLVITAFTTISSQIMNAFTASVGNLNAIGDTVNKERVFNRMFFISSWLHGFFSIGLLIFLSQLIDIWLGSEFILSKNVVFALVLHFYILNMHIPVFTYRTTMGLFVQGKWAPMLGAIINIVLSLWLGKLYGLFGIFIATSIARFLTTGIVDPYLVYKREFKKNPLNYHYKYFLFTGFFFTMYLVSNYVVGLILIAGILGFILKVFSVTIIFNTLMILVFWKSNDFKDIRASIKRLVKK